MSNFSKEISNDEADLIRGLQNKTNEIFIVTSKDYSGSNMIIWYFKSLIIAQKQYKELKRLKYKRVNISKVIK